MKIQSVLALAIVLISIGPLQGFLPKQSTVLMRWPGSSLLSLWSSPDPTAVPEPNPDPTTRPGVEPNPDPTTYPPPRPNTPAPSPKPKPIPTNPDHWPDAPKKGDPVM